MVYLKLLFLSAFFAVSWAGVYHDGSYEPEEKYYSAEEHKETPKPYHFGYEIQDHNGLQHRHEHADADGTVKGSYGFIDEKGVHRLVNYIADEWGFRAQVMTNEKGTSNDDPADVFMHSDHELSEDDHWKPSD